ncbi:hypothetical protein IscW_ISCW011497 [Ixodes scapularis]|uniref:Uncharacterized protein n=1 Tax=Ixodes scapularis TaxID=6945 RepID=B7Q7A1_IXOSC|nr:hypothetical protein IscW_ISCW011497 [Ixodes scapularis]|eukprot:XP_002412139.1 hypothetical protein IscW_ISCW011497 [Ixodes scapularis]
MLPSQICTSVCSSFSLSTDFFFFFCTVVTDDFGSSCVDMQRIRRGSCSSRSQTKEICTTAFILRVSTATLGGVQRLKGGGAFVSKCSGPFCFPCLNEQTKGRGCGVASRSTETFF